MADVAIPPQYRVRVKHRLRVLAYVEDHGSEPAARHFALSRATVRAWRDRHDTEGSRVCTAVPETAPAPA